MTLDSSCVSGSTRSLVEPGTIPIAPASIASAGVIFRADTRRPGKIQLETRMRFMAGVW